MSDHSQGAYRERLIDALTRVYISINGPDSNHEDYRNILGRVEDTDILTGVYNKYGRRARSKAPKTVL